MADFVFVDISEGVDEAPAEHISKQSRHEDNKVTEPPEVPPESLSDSLPARVLSLAHFSQNQVRRQSDAMRENHNAEGQLLPRKLLSEETEDRVVEGLVEVDHGLKGKTYAP